MRPVCTQSRHTETRRGRTQKHIIFKTAPVADVFILASPFTLDKSGPASQTAFNRYSSQPLIYMHTQHGRSWRQGSKTQPDTSPSRLFFSPLQSPKSTPGSSVSSRLLCRILCPPSRILCPTPDSSVSSFSPLKGLSKFFFAVFINLSYSCNKKKIFFFSLRTAHHIPAEATD